MVPPLSRPAQRVTALMIAVSALVYFAVSNGVHNHLRFVWEAAQKAL